MDFKPNTDIVNTLYNMASSCAPFNAGDASISGYLFDIKEIFIKNLFRKPDEKIDELYGEVKQLYEDFVNETAIYNEKVRQRFKEQPMEGPRENTYWRNSNLPQVGPIKEIFNEFRLPISQSLSYINSASRNSMGEMLDYTYIDMINRYFLCIMQLLDTFREYKIQEKIRMEEKMRQKQREEEEKIRKREEKYREIMERVRQREQEEERIRQEEQERKRRQNEEIRKKQEEERKRQEQERLRREEEQRQRQEQDRVRREEEYRKRQEQQEQEREEQRRQRQEERTGCPSNNKQPQRCNNKKDFFKQALIFHPDKNPECIANANEKFKLLQNLCSSFRGGSKKKIKYTKKKTRTKTKKEKRKKKKKNKKV